MATWTLADLTELDTAIKQGALRVRYRDRDVTYRSLEEMLQLRNLMQRELGITSTASSRRVVSVRKGTT